MMTNYPKDVEVEIALLPTEHGGRHSPLSSLSRPQFYYDGHDWDARYTWIDVEQVNPGEVGRAFLAFLSPDAHVGRIQPGKAFLLREGNRVIGYGSVKQVLDLAVSARRASETRSYTLSEDVQ
jgi:translation elongation factor EF-Tu-like GTPase